MIVACAEAVSGMSVYINPSLVVSVRPDPADPERTTVVRLSDGETLRLRGGHDDVAVRPEPHDGCRVMTAHHLALDYFQIYDVVNKQAVGEVSPSRSVRRELRL